MIITCCLVEGATFRPAADGTLNCLEETYEYRGLARLHRVCDAIGCAS
jgi:hypothetical protein